MPGTDEHECSIQASLDVLGDRWTILILRDAFRGVRRFDEFRRDLDIARPVLTDRLKRLVGARGPRPTPVLRTAAALRVPVDRQGNGAVADPRRA